MPVYYHDTSAIVKRYLEEQGTEVEISGIGSLRNYVVAEE